MKATFIDNRHSRPMVTIREDDPCWRGQTLIEPIPEGAIVRVYIPSDAELLHIEAAFEAIQKKALSVKVFKVQVERKAIVSNNLPGGKAIREIVLGMAKDADLLPLVEETLEQAKL